MFNELKALLNMPISVSEVKDKTGLPVYLAMRTMYAVSFDEVSFILVDVPQNSELQIRQLKKQLGIYQKKMDKNIAFSIASISKQLRSALIENKIPFVSLPNQVYLPFWGILLQDKYLAKASIQTVDKFTPTTQELFLLLAYSDSDALISKSDAARRLGVTNTSITRASSALKQVGLLQEEKHGTTLFIRKTLYDGAYFKKALPYLTSPVQERIFVEPSQKTDALPDAGEYALGNISMLQPPVVRVKACRKNQEYVNKLVKVDPLLETKLNYIQLELWRYSPELFAKNNIVDPISLYCSLMDENDERVENELNRVLEEHQWH